MNLLEYFTMVFLSNILYPLLGCGGVSFSLDWIYWVKVERIILISCWH